MATNHGALRHGQVAQGRADRRGRRGARDRGLSGPTSFPVAVAIALGRHENRGSRNWKTQAKIKQYRPWYDESARSLSILRQLTQAFPEDGVVTAKTLEIREANLVTCTGTARRIMRRCCGCRKNSGEVRQCGGFEVEPDSRQGADAVHL
jgi:hypothetical protein